MRERSHPFVFLCCKEPAGHFLCKGLAAGIGGGEPCWSAGGVFMAAGFPAKYGASFLGLHFWQNPDHSFAEHPGSFRVIQK